MLHAGRTNSTWEKRAQNILAESKKTQSRAKRVSLQHTAAVNLNLASELKAIMSDVQSCKGRKILEN